MTGAMLSRVAVSILAVSLVACSSDEGEQAVADAGADATDSADHDHHEGVHQTKHPACQRIMDACHPLDQGRPGRIHECHELALDDLDEESCAARLEECLDVCTL